MPANDVLDVNVDIVICIDVTGSMYPVLGTVKDNALTFYERLGDALLEYKRDLQDLRIKVIAFRDVTCDGSGAIQESEFFNLPQQKEEFDSFVKGLKAEGGGDEAETALDVLAHAMHSEWVAEGAKRRHVIVMWTDAPTKDPTGGNGIIQDSVNNIGELYALWQDAQNSIMDVNAKRLVLFTPNHESWNRLESWALTTHLTTELGAGLGDVDMATFLTFLAKSL